MGRATWVAVVVGGVALLAGCAGEDSPTPSVALSSLPNSLASAPGREAAGALPDPCALLTLPEAADLAGADLAEGVAAGAGPASGGAPTTCSWSPAAGGAAVVEVLVGDSAQAAFAAEESAGADFAEFEVAVADGAWTVGSTLYLRLHGGTIAVRVPGAATTVAEDLVALAPDVTDRALG